MDARGHKMRKREWAVRALAVVMTFAAMQVLAQKDEGPILRPNKPAKPAESTVLVVCDLACDWKLDGEAKGRIDAGGSAKTVLSLGQHLVAAAAEDALDKIETEIEIRTSGQTIVRLALQPVRDARLKAEQQAKEKAEQDAKEKADQAVRDKAAREQREKEQKERDLTAREQASGVAVDPATGLMWTVKVSDKEIGLDQAVKYCRNLKLAGHSDWRLPTVDEMKNCQLEGHLEGRADWVWTEDNSAYETRAYREGTIRVTRKPYKFSARALCLRGPGQ